MRDIWRGLFWTATFFCLVESRYDFSTLNNRPGENLFADILSEVLQTSRTKDALLIIRDSLDGQADDILSKILASTTRDIPTLYVNAQTQPEFQVSCAVSRDLVVYIYASEQEPDIVEGELVAEDIRSFIHTRVRPKVLLLMILRQPCCNLMALFRAIWSRKILDTIIVEYSGSDYSDEYSTIVHRYNPFTDSLTKEPYSTNVTWFAEDFPNMQGYPLKYGGSRRPPYSDFVSTEHGRILEGVDQMMIETLREKMNFTGIPTILEEPTYWQQFPNGTEYGIIPDLYSGTYDVFINTLPMLIPVYVQYTDAVWIEDWCFVIPGLPIKQTFMDTTAIVLFAISFLIVGMFWLCSKLMKLDPNRWHPLRIIGIMLTSSFPTEPKKLHERIVFLSIFAACARYSTTLFAELTSISLNSNRYLHFDSLQDLLDSDLVLMVHKGILDIITQENSVLEHHINTSNKEIVTVPKMEICLKELLMYQNVSCFMELGWAELAALNNMRDDETMLKTTSFCYLSPPAGYIFSKGSPYIRRVSDLLLMLAEGGIRLKWFYDHLWNETKETSFETDDTDDDTNFMFVSVFRPLLLVLVSGYSISVLVFIGELIWKYFDINLNSKRSETNKLVEARIPQSNCDE